MNIKFKSKTYFFLLKKSHSLFSKTNNIILKFSPLSFYKIKYNILLLHLNINSIHSFNYKYNYKIKYKLLNFHSITLKKKKTYNIKNILLVGSGKGGVGKSTIASNIALTLSNIGLNVGILDADIYGPSIPLIFNISPNTKIKGISEKLDNSPIMIPIKKYQIKIMSVAFLTKNTSAIIWRGPMLSSIITKMINKVLWGNLDCLIIDLPPGTGDIQLTILQQFPISGVVLVSTPQNISLSDVIRSYSMFHQAKIKIIGIVENMSYFTCDRCKKQHNIFNNTNLFNFCKKMSMNILEKIPIIPSVSKDSSNTSLYKKNNEKYMINLFTNLTTNIINSFIQNYKINIK